MDLTQEQQKLVQRMQKECGRSYEVCLFCLRYQLWDINKAVAMACAHPRECDTEGDRRRTLLCANYG